MGERRVGAALRSMFPGHSFVKVRPDWLRNPVTGRNLELDFFCQELGLAVEFNGEQHYRPKAMFHGAPSDLHRQRQRDQLKALLCEMRGVRLAVVRFDDPLADDARLCELIRTRLGLSNP